MPLAKFGLVDSIQSLFNIFEQEPADELFPESAKTGTGIIARVPLYSGALTGNWNENTYSQWEEGDKRHSMYRGDRFKETLDRINALKKLCKPYYSNLAEATLRFTLYPKEVSCVIPGMRNKHEIDLNKPKKNGININ